MAGYFPRSEFRRVFSEPAVRVLEQLAQFADTIDRLGTTETAVATVTDALEDANLSLDTLDERLDAVEAFTNSDPRYVRQDQTTAWADATGTVSRAGFTVYAGQTVSNPPTQAEVQAIDDHVKLLSQHLAGLVNDLRAIGALS
jgi:hypothetical protein